MLVQEHKAYRFFLNSIRSPETRKKYIFYVSKYLEYLDCYDADTLLQKSPRLIESELIEFIIKLRDQNKNYYAIQNYVTAVVSFFKINDVMLNKNKITKFMPEQKIRRKGRAYTHKEIHSLLDTADERMRAVILLLSSFGFESFNQVEDTDYDKYQIDGHKSPSTIFSGKLSGIDLAGWMVSTMIGNKLFTFTYLATPDQFDANFPTRELMLESIKILDEQ